MTPPWRPFLERFSRELLTDPDIRLKLPPDVVASGWLGFPPAEDDEIDALEERLGAKLPASYRTFLQTSNGWRDAGAFIYDLLPASGVTWFRDTHQDWIDVWLEAGVEYGGPHPVSDEDYFVYGPEQKPENFRDEYWCASLAISSRGDGAIYLLNPMIMTTEGEWEAWFFANWAPGADRYRSFWEMMQAELAGFIKLRDRPAICPPAIIEPPPA